MYEEIRWPENADVFTCGRNGSWVKCLGITLTTAGKVTRMSSINRHNAESTSIDIPKEKLLELMQLLWEHYKE